MIQNTSLNAYFSEVQPSLGQRQQAVLEALQKFPNMTNLEISNYLNLPINSVTPRVKELRDKGLVTQACGRACRVSGRNVMAWKLKKEQRQLQLI